MFCSAEMDSPFLMSLTIFFPFPFSFPFSFSFSFALVELVPPRADVEGVGMGFIRCFEVEASLAAGALLASSWSPSMTTFRRFLGGFSEVVFVVVAVVVFAAAFFACLNFCV